MPGWYFLMTPSVKIPGDLFGADVFLLVWMYWFFFNEFNPHHWERGNPLASIIKQIK